MQIADGHVLAKECQTTRRRINQKLVKRITGKLLCGGRQGVRGETILTGKGPILPRSAAGLERKLFEGGVCVKHSKKRGGGMYGGAFRVEKGGEKKKGPSRTGRGKLSVGQNQLFKHAPR